MPANYPQQQTQANPNAQPQSAGALGQAVIGGVSQKVASKNPLTFFLSRENQKGMRRLVNLQNNVIWTIVATIALITALGLLIAYGVGNDDGKRNTAYLIAGLSTLLVICLPLYIITGSGFARAKRCAGSISGIAIPAGKGKVLKGLRGAQRLSGGSPQGASTYPNVNPYQQTGGSYPPALSQQRGGGAYIQ